VLKVARNIFFHGIDMSLTFFYSSLFFLLGMPVGIKVTFFTKQ
jgi:hypothetical protein